MSLIKKVRNKKLWKVTKTSIFHEGIDISPDILNITEVEKIPNQKWSVDWELILR